MNNLTFQYSPWWIVLCLAIGLLYAVLLYFQEKQFQDLPGYARWLMGGFRFLTVSFIGILLLGPLLRALNIQRKDPIIVLAQDVSQSVAANWSADEQLAYARQFEKLKSDLQKQFQVDILSFGDEVRTGLDTGFQDKVTNLSKLMSAIEDRYAGDNLGAVVLATDGIYNQGSNPIYRKTNLATPVFALALGDTTQRKDLILKRAFFNRIVYLGDRFSVQVDINGINSAGSTTRLRAYRITSGGREQVHEQTIRIDRNSFFQTVEFILDAKEAGVQRYRLELSPIAGEQTRANNYKDIFVDVLDSRQKILLLAHAPHPDLTAIKQGITSNKNYEVEIGYANQLPGVSGYDFVVLHQLPSREYPVSATLQRLDQERIPHLFITGPNTSYTAFNQAQGVLKIKTDGRNTNEAQGRLLPGFNLFTVSEELEKTVPQFPPLEAPFGEYQAGVGSSVLLAQRIRKIDTQYPLLVYGPAAENRVGVLAGEGIWRWRLFDYLQHENHVLFNELISKTVQYLSVKEDKRKFRVSLPKNIFDENEPVFFDAELYNNSYELINTPDVQLTVTNADGKDFNYVLNKVGRAYQLEIGILPVGNYRYRASVSSDGQVLSAEGRFSVQPIQLELFERTADHNLLRLISNRYGGQLIAPDSISQLPGIIAGRDTVKPVVFQNTTTRSAINLRWLFFLALALLSAEWFLRRYWGGY